MENYKLIRCCIDVYVPVDNVDIDGFKNVEDLEDEITYSAIDSIEKAISTQTQNSNNILYQSTFEVYENDR